MNEWAMIKTESIQVELNGNIYFAIILNWYQDGRNNIIGTTQEGSFLCLEQTQPHQMDMNDSVMRRIYSSTSYPFFASEHTK